MRIISEAACRSDFHMNKNFTKVKLENIKLKIVMLAFHLSLYFFFEEFNAALFTSMF